MNFNIEHLLVLSVAAAIAFFLRALYLEIASVASAKSLVGKLRKPVRVAFLVFMATLAMIGFSEIFRITGDILFVPIILGLTSSFTILFSLVMVLFNQSCRLRIARSVNNTKEATDRTLKNRYVAFILFVTGRIFKVLGMAVMALLGVFTYLLRNGLGGANLSSSEGPENHWADQSRRESNEHAFGYYDNNGKYHTGD